MIQFTIKYWSTVANMIHWHCLFQCHKRLIDTDSNSLNLAPTVYALHRFHARNFLQMFQLANKIFHCCPSQVILFT